jgi:hypothetical protein
MRAAVAIALLAFYAVCYAASVQRSVGYFGVQPIYRVGGNGWRTAFAPAHGIDRLLRPRYWAPVACVW